MARTGHEVEQARMPWFKFFWSDWLTSAAVECFTLEQQAAYLRLLIHQWNTPDGILTNDPAELARISRLGGEWRKLGRPILRRCFARVPGGWSNPKLRDLWRDAQKKSQKCRKGARARWNGHAT
jgi:uncharacterized protein YdaU (DUF1376 family)